MDYFAVHVNFTKTTKGLVYSTRHADRSELHYRSQRAYYCHLNFPVRSAFHLCIFFLFLSAGLQLFIFLFLIFELSAVNKVNQSMSLICHALCNNKHELSRSELYWASDIACLLPAGHKSETKS